MLCLGLVGLGAADSASAQTEVVTYHFDNVMFVSDINNPYGYGPTPMTGEFTWTYQVGDFENGTANFLWVDIPWYGSDLNGLVTTVDMGSIELSLAGNFHGYGLNVGIKLEDQLYPNQSSVINSVLSEYEWENGLITRGHIFGKITPDRIFDLSITGASPNLTFDLVDATPGAQVALLYSFNTGSFIIPAGQPCAGTTLGLDAGVAVGALLTADALGSASYSTSVPAAASGRVWVQALDMDSCATTTTLLLP